jgi:hypothetical protein
MEYEPTPVVLTCVPKAAPQTGQSQHLKTKKP